MAYGEKKARPRGRAASRSAPLGVSFRLPAHARLAPARLTVVRVRMMVGANDRHAGKVTATRELVNVAARGMHAAATLTTTDYRRPNCARRTL